MKTIWKFEAFPHTPFDVSIPKGATFLSVQMQGKAPQMWWLVESDARTEVRRFAVYGTGHRIKSQLALTFLGTFQIDPTLVFHLFEQLSPYDGDDRYAERRAP